MSESDDDIFQFKGKQHLVFRSILTKQEDKKLFLTMTIVMTMLVIVTIGMCALTYYMSTKMEHSARAVSTALLELATNVTAACDELRRMRRSEEEAPEAEEPAAGVDHVSIDLPFDTWSTPNSPRSWSTEASSEDSIITVLRDPGVPSSSRSGESGKILGHHPGRITCWIDP